MKGPGPAVVLLALALTGALGCGRKPVQKHNGADPSSAASAPSAMASSAPADALAPASASASAAARDASAASRKFAFVARLASPKPAFHDAFGATLAHHDGTVAVGCPHRAEPSLNAGVVYLFKREDSWALVQTLQNPQPRTSPEFGRVTAFVGDRLLIPPHWFDRTGLEFASTGALESPPEKPYANFGSAIAVRGSELVITARGEYGTPGRAFRYSFERGSIKLEERVDPVPRPENYENFYMGTTVAFDERHLVLGTPQDPYVFSETLVFVRDDKRWRLKQRLAGRVGKVAVLGNVLLIGADTLDRKYFVAVYREDAGSFSLVDRLPASIGVALGDGFAALSNGRLYRWDGEKMIEDRTLTRPDGKPFSGAGPILLDGRLLVIGEPGEGAKGAAYVFEASE